MSVVAWDHLECYGHGKTDINSWHFYTRDYEFARKHISDVVRETYVGSACNYVDWTSAGIATPYQQRIRRLRCPRW